MGWKQEAFMRLACAVLLSSLGATAMGLVGGCEKKPVPAVAAASGVRVTVDGAGFASPAGWTRVSANDQGIKAYFIGPESSTSDMRSRAITVEVLLPPVKGDAMAVALDKASKWGGRVEEKRDLIDGVEAVRVRVYAAQIPELTSRLLGIITIRGGKLYIVSGWAPERKSIRDEVEALIGSWKWDK
ncbi:MAG: hypothetical protein JWN40_5133 [Phycisphaerales bacterium]|nr:hypothetical protein [Phycisphaerales bacterium]